MQLALAKARQRLVCRGGGDEPGGAEQGSGEQGGAEQGVSRRTSHVEDAEVAEMGSVLQLLLRSQV